MRRCPFEDCRHVNRREAWYCARCGRGLRATAPQPPGAPRANVHFAPVPQTTPPSVRPPATRRRSSGGRGNGLFLAILAAVVGAMLARWKPQQPVTPATFDVEAYREDHRRRQQFAARVAERATRRQLARERGEWSW